VTSIEGVAEALADINAHTVTVTFEDTKTGLEAIKKALETAGFSVPGEPVRVESAPQPPGGAKTP
jgi:copper chaperone CopZ